MVSSSSVTTDELRAALQSTLAHPIAELQRRASMYASTFPLEDVSVRLEDRMEMSLVFKDLSPSAATAIRPDCVYEPRREIEMYRSVLAARRLGTATCYAAVTDELRQRYWLVLEKVPGLELYQWGNLRIWQAAARWVAELHATMRVERESLAQSAPVLRHSGDFYVGWMQRALAYARDADQLQALGRLARGHAKVVDRLTTLSPTLIHGEFYASNVMVEPLAQGVRVCPIDWEMAALGPGLMDLAALTGGSWPEPGRQAIVQAYRDAHLDFGDQSLSERDFAVALDCCRLQLAIQWLGWSPTWQPPSAQAHNWLAEALDAADRLGL
jgi:hypothetical protein